MADWRKLRDLYVAGTASYQEIAQAAGVQESTVRARASRERWNEARDAVRSDAFSRSDAGLEEALAARTQSLFEAAEMILLRIKQDVSDAQTMHNSRAVKDYTGALKDIRDIFGIKTTGDTREQEARIAKLEKDIAADKEAVIHVVMDGGMDELSQ